MKWLTWLVFVPLLAAACSGGSTSSDDRLLVLRESDLVTMRPDGTAVEILTTDDERLIRQPTWSPDGEKVAWASAVEQGPSVISARPDGSDRLTTPLGFLPFYMGWDPTSTRLALLGTGAQEIEMATVQPGEDGPNVLDKGQPYYLAWSPDGQDLLVHVSNNRLQLLDSDGRPTDIDDSPGIFQAPQWVPQADRILYATRQGSVQTLVTSDRQERTELLEFDGFISFAASPDGSRIAYRVLEHSADAIPANFTTAQVVTDERLEIVSIEGGEPTVVPNEDLVVAFFWSHQSDRLLFLTLAGDEFRWNVWDGDSVTTYEGHKPTATFGRDYLPFFDQFIQSIDLWSPDGTAFAYPAEDDAGTDGIWVQTIDEPDPQRVGDGSFVSWSP